MDIAAMLNSMVTMLNMPRVSTPLRTGGFFFCTTGAVLGSESFGVVMAFSLPGFEFIVLQNENSRPRCF
jgi:hypothetical protein